MRLYRVKFDGIAYAKKQINVPVESKFCVGVEIDGYDDLETAGIKLGSIEPASFDKDGRRAIFEVSTSDSDISFPVILDGKPTDATLFVNTSDAQPSVGFGGSSGGGTISLSGTYGGEHAGETFGFDVMIQE